MKKYVYGLDGLRTLAIFGVVFYHLTPYNVSGGFLGVNIFFIISGLLLTQKIERLLQTPIGLADYIFETIILRLFRLLKPLASMLVLVLSAVTILQPKLLQNIAEMFVASITLLNNIWQIVSGASYFERHFGQSVFTHLWYVATLFQMTISFVVVYFLVYHIVKNKQIRAFIILLFIGASYTALLVQFQLDTITRVYYGTDTRLFDFLWGAFLALTIDDFKRLTLKNHLFQRVLLPLILLMLIAIAFVITNDQQPVTYQYGLMVFDIITVAFIVVGLAKSSVLLPVFENPIVHYFGTRSYAYYLWYFPILTIYQAYIKELTWLPVLTITLLILIVGELFYQLFEQRDIYQWRHIIPFYKRFIKSIRTQHRHVTWFNTFKFVVLPLCWSIILIIAPKGPNQEALALQQQIAANAKLQEANQQSDGQSKSTAQQTGDKTIDKPITIIGDSVTLSMYQQLNDAFTKAVVDGKVSRQFYHGVEVVESLKTQQKLHDTVVIMLGRNGPFTKAQVEELLDTIGNDKTVYFLTLYGTDAWLLQMNQLLKTVEQEKNNVVVLDWASHSKAHSQWYYADLVHLNAKGIQEMVAFLTEHIK